MLKKTTCILLLIFFVTSCADTFGSVKRGLTGSKSKSADEFLVKKKDPLVLPPDYENLPNPDEEASKMEEASIFEKGTDDLDGENAPTSDTVEESILKNFQSK